MKEILVFHLFNDNSGSPSVLHLVLSQLAEKRYNIILHTSRAGVLSDLDRFSNIRIRYYYYYYLRHRFFAFFLYFFTQIYLFVYCFRYLFKTRSVFYINTILPIGPAFFAFIFRRKLIYHYHESLDNKGFFYLALTFFMTKFASKIICVSHYQNNLLASNKTVTIYNTVPNRFFYRFDNKLIYSSPHRVLMVSSLKVYKGILEYVKLASFFPYINFDLVLNADQHTINLFFRRHQIPENLFIHSKQADVYPFYVQTHLLVNLSIPELFVETFGLTVLEAMALGIPVIVPPLGGTSELVIDGYNGFKVHSKDFSLMIERINTIFACEDGYMQFSTNAMKESLKYKPDVMISKITQIIELK